MEVILVCVAGRAAGERTLLRIGAVSAILGVITLFVADTFHGGHDPADLEATLPEYAANANWEVVHIGQFLGYALVLISLVALYRSITEGRGVALARLGYVTVVLATAVYAVNQAVDGVAVKFVADEWVSAPAAEQANAFRVAQAVRHIEIGLSSFAQLILGAAFFLYGLAIALSDVYPKWLGWAAVVVGIGWVVLGLLVAHNGFTQVDLTISVGVLLALWVLVLAVFLWRKAGKTPNS
jgi:hypothetical protein